MSDETYNGWKNYPTWAVALWLNNDQGLQEAAYELVRDNNTGEWPRASVADAFKQWVADDLCTFHGYGDATMASDLLGYALDSVDWFEVADAFIADYAEVTADA